MRAHVARAVGEDDDDDDDERDVLGERARVAREDVARLLDDVQVSSDPRSTRVARRGNVRRDDDGRGVADEGRRERERSFRRRARARGERWVGEGGEISETDQGAAPDGVAGGFDSVGRGDGDRTRGWAEDSDAVRSSGCGRVSERGICRTRNHRSGTARRTRRRISETLFIAWDWIVTRKSWR